MMLQDAIKDFYVSLLAGDVDALTDIYAGEPLVNTPLQGEVKGAAAFTRFVEERVRVYNVIMGSGVLM